MRRSGSSAMALGFATGDLTDVTREQLRFATRVGGAASNLQNERGGEIEGR